MKEELLTKIKDSIQFAITDAEKLMQDFPQYITLLRALHNAKVAQEIQEKLDEYY